MDLNLQQRAIEFFKKETDTDQITEPSVVSIIKLMVMFAKSENNSELELVNQELTERNNILATDVCQFENKVDELNNDVSISQSIIDSLQETINQKELATRNLLIMLEDINIKTLALVESYNTLMTQHEESQHTLKELFKKGLSAN